MTEKTAKQSNPIHLLAHIYRHAALNLYNRYTEDTGANKVYLLFFHLQDQERRQRQTIKL